MGDRAVDKYLFIAGTLVLTAFGQLIIKARALAVQSPGGGQAGYLLAMLFDPWVWVGLAGAVLASVCWILALRQLDVSVAYPFTALSFLIVPLGALIFFGERIGPMQWLGSCLIIGGVIVSTLGAQR